MIETNRYYTCTLGETVRYVAYSNASPNENRLTAIPVSHIVGYLDNERSHLFDDSCGLPQFKTENLTAPDEWESVKEGIAFWHYKWNRFRFSVKYADGSPEASGQSTFDQLGPGLTIIMTEG